MASLMCEGGFFYGKKQREIKNMLKKALWHGIGIYNGNL